MLGNRKFVCGGVPIVIGSPRIMLPVVIVTFVIGMENGVALQFTELVAAAAIPPLQIMESRRSLAESIVGSGCPP